MHHLEFANIGFMLNTIIMHIKSFNQGELKRILYEFNLPDDRSKHKTNGHTIKPGLNSFT